MILSFLHQKLGCKVRKSRKIPPAMIPDAGIVMNQATMIFLATPQRTAEIL
jgi:hypothetical protein